MNEIKKFMNEKFGTIRTVLINNEPFKIKKYNFQYGHILIIICILCYHLLLISPIISSCNRD